MESEESKEEQPAQPLSADADEGGRACPACGARARRARARFCATCGRAMSDGYRPADALRASYHLHRRASVNNRTGITKRTGGGYTKRSMTEVFPARNRNGAATTALAFVTYSLVPYLGILFCPGALLMGGLGLFRSYSAPQVGGRRTALMGLALGLLILCAQLFMWWILYKVPEWNRKGNFGF